MEREVILAILIHRYEGGREGGKERKGRKGGREIKGPTGRKIDGWRDGEKRP